MRILIVALCALLLSGCAHVSMQKLTAGEAPVVIGPAVRANRTPLANALICYDRKLAPQLAGKKLQIAVGEIKDYTGKLSDSEGSAITQGGSPMLFTALYKLKDAVDIHDRFDTRVTDLELKYIGLKQLGDGKENKVDGKSVPWYPYYGGSVRKSDYTILGGITELNFNIQSGGGEFRFDLIGPSVRMYTLSVAADLRLVKTQTLEVVSAVSMQKQFVGYEVGLGIFKFMNLDGSERLFDINTGYKSQEPMQLGIRAILEESVLHLLSDVSGVSYRECLPADWEYTEEQEMPPVPVVPVPPAPAFPVPAQITPAPVAPPPAPMAKITAELASIKKGASTTLAWNSENSAECSLAPDIGAVKPTGSLVVSPALSTTYKLACKGNGGTTESSVAVEVIQQTLDSDMDGVIDELDKCPDTPIGTKVDKTGCPTIDCKTMVLHITFDTNKSDIRESDHGELETVANNLNTFPHATVVIEGRTDNYGSHAWNMTLSQRRAEAVKQHLVANYGIDASRITAIGYGKTNPIDTNETNDGRRNNRSIIAVFTCPD